MIKVLNINNQKVNNQLKFVPDLLPIDFPCKLSNYNLRKIVEATTDTSSFVTADKIAETERLNKIQSVVAILAIISQRNHAWRDWIRNSCVCFSICELEIRYAFAGIKN
jgi:hypothetical protein